MVDDPSPHQYYSELQRRGGTLQLFEKIRYVDSCTRIANVEPIYTLNHLAIRCKLPLKVLIAVLNDLDDYYNEFKVSKKSKKGPRSLRKISAPKNELLAVQREILRALTTTNRISPSAFAYVPGKGTRDAAQLHIGALTIIRLDISDFFGSIPSASVHKIFVAHGYPKLLAFQMTLFCTRGISVEVREGQNPSDYLYSISGDGFLPQGAPTSGLLSNLVFEPLDRKIELIALKFNAVYTRYADDMHFSFSRRISASDAKDLIFSIKNLLKSRSFDLNAEKTQIQRNPESIRLLGLRVSSTKVGIGRTYKNKVLGMIHAIEKYGLASVAERNNCVDDAELASKLDGHFCYIYGVDREFAYTISDRVKEITKDFL